jgi:hydrogenase/urease accessory protein HupE
MPRLLTLIFFIFSSLLFAHTVKPAYLEIKHIENNNYKITLKVPILNDNNITISPKFPSFCKVVNIDSYRDNTLFFKESILRCNSSIIGESISINHTEDSIYDVMFYFSQDDISYFKNFNTLNTSIQIPSRVKQKNSSLEFILLGIEHILLGYDHLLFVLALLLLIDNRKKLIQTITAFTFAHSITLIASTLGYISIHELFIELLIALSIVILATEILYAEKRKHGITSKYPWVVALFFGLIHGFGFANVLSEIELPKDHFFMSLLLFNIGVELGQLLFIGLLLLLYYLYKNIISKRVLLPWRTVVAYILGITASYWLIERLVNSLLI